MDCLHTGRRKAVSQRLLNIIDSHRKVKYDVAQKNPPFGAG